MSNLSDLREVVRQGKKAHECFRDAVEVVDELIRLQAAIDDKKAEEIRLDRVVRMGREEAAQLNIDLEKKLKTSRAFDTEIRIKERKAKEMREFLLSGHKGLELELEKESKARIMLIKKAEDEKVEGYRESTKAAQKVLDNKLAAISKADSTLDETRKGILDLLNK